MTVSSPVVTPSMRQVERIARIADMTCSAHSALRDRYERKAQALDLLILGSSIWLVAVAFVDAGVARKLTPGCFDPHIFIGILAVVTFFLSIVQLKTDWKGRADAHRRSADTYGAVKREARYALNAHNLGAELLQRVIDRNDMASVVSISIPERDFLAQKKRHLLKTVISRHLDSRPASSIVLLRTQLWWRDTFKK